MVSAGWGYEPRLSTGSPATNNVSDLIRRWSALRESNPVVRLLQSLDFPSVSGRMVAPHGLEPCPPGFQAGVPIPRVT